MIEKIKQNKILKMIGNILYALIVTIVILMLLIVIMQRFTNNNITIAGIRIFAVETGSMIPVYEVGDILISKQIKPENIKIGDDLVYKGKEGSYKGKVVTHRVIDIDKMEDGNYKIITKGVANTAQDPEINQTQVYGKVIFNAKILNLISKLVRNTYAFYIMMAIPIVILICANVKNIINMGKNNNYIEEEIQEDDDHNEN